MQKPKDDEEGPERTCIVTRTKATPEVMIRFVLGPDMTVVPDIRRKLPGRGVWVTARSSLVAAAIKKQAFARGFKTKVTVPASLAADIGDLLARDCLQALSMANKAGIVVAGFAKVEAAIMAGSAGVLLHAVEAGEDGVRKIDGAARRQRAAQAAAAGDPARAAAKPSLLSLKLFSSDQLDLALGRTNVIHASLAVGPASKAFLMRCERLMRYRSDVSPDVSADADADPRLLA